MDKVFKTTDELIQLLVSRNIDISTDSRKGFAKKTLQHVGYYNLINGYSKLFLSAPDYYKSGTTIEEIYALYCFDKKLREIFLKYVLEIETNTKTLIAYCFSQKYGHDNYLIYKNFNTHSRNAAQNISAVISDLNRQLSSRVNDPSISHYLSKYGYVPLWVLNNILTLGQVSKFYSIMKQPDRQQVSKVFRITDNQLESILFSLSSVRNFCAHGNRLYCFRTKNPLIDFAAHTELNIPCANSEFMYGKRDLFAALIALSYVLPVTAFKRLIKEISNALNKLRLSLNVINEDDVLKEMGFPHDWKTELLNLSHINKK